MGKYAYIKKVDADWLSVAMQHLKFRIKMLVLRCSLKRKDYETLKRNYIYPMVKDLLDDIDNQDLKNSCADELILFANTVYEEMEKVASVMSPKEIALALLPPNFLTSFQKQEVGDSRQVLVNLEKETSYQLAEAIKKARPNGFKGSAYTRATPNDTYYPEVHDATKKWIQNIFDIKTPNKPFIANVNPRAYAEMNVRYEKYKADKESLIAQGVKLVLVPAHANCSKRCQRYQGKIYSLDGTSGSVAGHNYVPIEDVSDKVTYTSKSTGRTYFAGLFSYNCRHTLQPYKEGQLIEEIPDEVIEKQREIEERQRQMERNYRTMREKASILREIANESGNAELKKVAHQMDIQASLQRKEYVMYCERNEVPMYPERLKLIDGEGIYLRNGAKRDIKEVERVGKIIQHNVYVEDVNGTKIAGNDENNTLNESKENDIISKDEIKNHCSEVCSNLLERADNYKVDYKPVKRMKEQQTNQEIIKTISGGDLTSGSCASLSMAYIGRCAGYDVLDYRGGNSMEFFSMPINNRNIRNFEGVKSEYISRIDGSTQIGRELVSRMEIGKEYMLNVGRHSSIVKKDEDGYLMYLELQCQMPELNKWTSFKNIVKSPEANVTSILRERFGCTTSAGSGRSRYIRSGMLVEVETLKASKDLQATLGYINTAEDEQKKGEKGQRR